MNRLVRRVQYWVASEYQKAADGAIPIRDQALTNSQRILV